jgi:thioesterase domain-containing protein
MTPAELEAYLHRHIPITAAMQVGVEGVGEDEVVLSAPLEPNINHRATLFGGSASTICILACWSLVHLKLTGAGVPHRLVIQRNTMSYDAPVTGRFSARARLAAEADWTQTLLTFVRHRKARIATEAALLFDGRVAGRMQADFVALG